MGQSDMERMERLGLFATYDSGAPAGVETYHTLVIFHGLAWHSGTFRRLLSLAGKFNTRILLVNRRDYPGSERLKEEELQQISAIGPDTPEPLPILEAYMKQRAREVHDFLGLFIEAQRIPQAGGLTVCGWSFGTIWMMALLSFTSSFSDSGIDLASYIRRVIIHDPPYHVLGYSPPENNYNPFMDLSLLPEERVKAFPIWVSGYYSHGDTASELEQRKPLSDPRPTIEIMSARDIEEALHPQPANPDGSDAILFEIGIRHGLFSALREGSIFLGKGITDSWSSIELTHVWCDHSVWETTWGAWALQAELEEAKKSAKQTRPVKIVRIEGANHFVHWDQPEQSLQVFLANDISDMIFFSS